MNGGDLWVMDQHRASERQAEKEAFLKDQILELTAKRQALEEVKEKLTTVASETWLSKSDDARAEGLREAVEVVRLELSRIDACLAHARETFQLLG